MDESEQIAYRQGQRAVDEAETFNTNSHHFQIAGGLINRATTRSYILSGQNTTVAWHGMLATTSDRLS